MVILKTIVGNLSANINEITFTDATINSNSIIEVYYNSNDIYTVETWQRENTIGIVTSDHDFPVSVKVLINNVVAFEPYDDTSLVNRIDGLEDSMGDAEDAISGLAGRVGDAEDDIDTLENAVSNLNTTKQDVLTAGDNITIENNVISASGGGGVNYSLDEQDTGLKWIDGNNIYQKTVLIANYNVNLNDTSWTYIFDLPGISYTVYVKLHGQTPNVYPILRFNGYGGKMYGASKYNINLQTLGTIYATFFYIKSTT